MYAFLQCWMYVHQVWGHRVPGLPCHWGQMDGGCSCDGRKRERKQRCSDWYSSDKGEAVGVHSEVGADTTDAWAWWLILDCLNGFFGHVFCGDRQGG